VGVDVGVDVGPEVPDGVGVGIDVGVGVRGGSTVSPVAALFKNAVFVEIIVKTRSGRAINMATINPKDRSLFDPTERDLKFKDKFFSFVFKPFPAFTGTFLETSDTTGLS
jgi:hypothetical protein